MNVSQKCQYALRAILELAKHRGGGPVKIAVIAQAQAIPTRFLEVILGELKQGGFVESRRGMQGGYLLSRPPEDLTAGQIIRFVDGPLWPVKCLAHSTTECPLQGRCAFMDMWIRARDAVTEVYNSMTFGNLVENDKALPPENTENYCI